MTTCEQGYRGGSLIKDSASERHTVRKKPSKRRYLRFTKRCRRKFRNKFAGLFSESGLPEVSSRLREVDVQRADVPHARDAELPAALWRADGHDGHGGLRRPRGGVRSAPDNLDATVGSSRQRATYIDR